jgi:hypothetical protein
MSRSETDSVSPDEGNVSGEVTDRRFAYTLAVTDIATKWSEERALKNKAHRWVRQAYMPPSRSPLRATPVESSATPP